MSDYQDRAYGVIIDLVLRLSDKVKCAYLIRLTFNAYCLESGVLMHMYGGVLSEQDIVNDIRKGLIRLPVNVLNKHIEVLKALVDAPEGFMTSPVTIVDINRNVYTFRTDVIGGKFLEFNVTPDYAGRIRFNEDVVLLDYLGDFSLDVSFKLCDVAL